MNEILTAPEFWKFTLPLSGVVVAWFTNEWRKRVADQYQRKEANYKELLRSLRGFYEGETHSEELQIEFLNQLNFSWLYCPDDVIQRGYDFLDTVHAEKASTADQKQLALGALVAAIRNDLLSRHLVRKTKLLAKDFKHLKSSKARPRPLTCRETPLPAVPQITEVT